MAPDSNGGDVSSTPSELAEKIRAAINVDWYGPNPEYRAVVEAGFSALDSLEERLRIAEERVRKLEAALGQSTDTLYYSQFRC